MMGIRYIVTLSDAEYDALEQLQHGGKCGVRKLKRAQILLAAEHREEVGSIARSLSVGAATVYRTTRRYVEEGLEAALSESPREGASRKLAANEEAMLVAIACSKAPAGRSRWTLELLADELVVRTGHGGISRETVRRRLHENQLKPWQKKMWCVPSIDAEYVARMEDVLELYSVKPQDGEAVVCFDETPYQVIGETRQGWPMEPGKAERVDYEYRRHGCANLFVHLDAHRGWRHVEVTERKTALDFAKCMHDLALVHYRDATKVHVVLDNYAAHRPSALYEVYDACTAREVLKRLDFHYVPKHASWLNMVEIEIGVLMGQCLDRRIGDWDTLRSELVHWQNQRNHQRARINWLFDVERARHKLGAAYPRPSFDQEQAA
jgi:transposase